MELINKYLYSQKLGELGKKKFKKGDMVVLHYNSVGDSTKVKELVGIFESESGSGLNKGVSLNIPIKGGGYMKLHIYLNSPLLFNLKRIGL